MIITAGVNKILKIVFKNFIYLPVQDSIFLEHETRRITKRRGEWFYGLLHDQANQELFLGDLVNNDFTNHQAFLKNSPMFLKKNTMPSAAATIT
jgi:hypothetical protein